jgi:cytidine deaminase
MTEQFQALIAAARQAREHSYSPYSGFRVGAALLTADGRVFTGTNVENASFGLSICAERAAVFKAVTAGVRDFSAIAIYADGEQPTPPCGACRQVLLEFAPQLTVLMCGENGAVEEYLASDLLARPFLNFRTEEKK